MDLHLMRPQWLWALLPALLLFTQLWRQRGRSGSWTDVIAPELLPHLMGDKAAPRRTNLLPLVLIAWVLAVLAASGPSWEKIPQPIHQKQDALVLVLDLSYSMKSQDLAPTRLDRARQKLQDLLADRKEGQTGLIAYAGDAHIVTPLTDDTPTIANLLPALSPDMMPIPGSNPAAAIELAVELMHSAGIRQGKILLVTDGVADKDRKRVEQAMSGKGMQLAVMGVGTATGAPIPLPRGGFLKDDAGTIVMPSLDEQNLRELANSLGGRYQRMQIDNGDLDYLLSGALLPDTAPTLALDRSADTWHDQGYLLIVLLLPVVLGLFRRGWFFCLLPLLFTLQPEPAHASMWNDLWLTRDQQAQRALAEGDTAAAAELFDNPDWAGTAAYRGEDYDTAIDNFSNRDSADAWYNRGNALARAGRLDEAIEAYRESLALQPQQDDARENIELLEQLKQQQDQQQQSEQDQDRKENESQEQESQSKGQEQEQDQNPADSQQPDQPGQGSPQDSEQQGQENEPEDAEQDQAQASQDEEEPEEGAAQPDQPEDASEAEQQAQATQVDPGELERDQAMEQWLRRVPDDPSGLLREKFRYESQQRQQQGNRREDETLW